MNKLYIFENVDNIADREHPDGGLVIITCRDPKAVWTENWLRENRGKAFGSYNSRIDFTDIDLSSPDKVVELEDNVPESIHVFLDSGCC